MNSYTLGRAPLRGYRNSPTFDAESEGLGSAMTGFIKLSVSDMSQLPAGAQTSGLSVRIVARRKTGTAGEVSFQIPMTLTAPAPGGSGASFAVKSGLGSSIKWFLPLQPALVLNADEVVYVPSGDELFTTAYSKYYYYYYY
jgi:hypothetical protein